MTGCGKFIREVTIEAGLWKRLRETARCEGIPYQWEALNDRLPDAEPSYCMRNFHAAAGKIQAEHGGFVFQDSDVAKWLEAVAYSLTWHPDAELEAIADGAIDDIVAAQQPDGYLDTYYILTGIEKRWTNLMDHHEMYCAGHMLEAAVAYYQATGKRKLLNAMQRLVAHIDSVFGAEPEKLHGYPGHPELELALMRLYDLTQDECALRLAEYFIRQRGQDPIYFLEEIKRNHLNWYWKDGPLQMQYYQAHQPLTEQKDAVGHSVRALYLYSALADVARQTNDPDLLEAAERLWRSVTHRRMYITGGVGSSSYGEAFTFDYDLPNDTIYGETCASIALVFFAQRMLRIEANGEYADVMERALYNGIISGMQLDGKKFFYVNPLEVVPEACKKDAHKNHVKPERQKWFACACCPPNIIRLLMSLNQYILSVNEDTLFFHLYVQGASDADLPGGSVHLETATNYPWDGDISVSVNPETAMSFVIALHIPEWCRDYRIKVNDSDIDYTIRDGYAYIRRKWHQGDRLTLNLAMPVYLVAANPRVRENVGQAAVMRGPVVYCLEEADNGDQLHLVRLGDVTPEQFRVEPAPDWLGEGVVLRSSALRESISQEDSLYMDASSAPSCQPVELYWIPYFAWANRSIGEMRVWVRK